MQILAGAAIFNKEGKILLLQQKKDGDQPLLWGPPAGHGNEWESPIQTAIRETKEETNLDIEVENLVQVGIVHVYDGRKYLFITYKAKAKDLNLFKIDPGEVKDSGWFGLEDIKNNKVKLRGEFLKEPLVKSFSKNLGEVNSYQDYYYTEKEATAIRV